MIHEQIVHPSRGPQNESLSTWYHYTPGPRSKCLLHISGLHGVEGHLGSLIQKRLLEKDFDKLPFQVVIVETVNPFGLAWSRRANEANVDLNRNSLHPYEIPNPEFRHFHRFLQTGRWTEFLKLLPIIARIGIAGTVQTVACGQSEFPDSLFFSGTELQPELQSLEANLKRIIAPGTNVHALDVHTGLGKYGKETLILNGFESDAENLFFRRVFQKQPLNPGHDPNSYRADGSLALLLRKIWGHENVFYLVQEFGTQPFYLVLSALISENQFFQAHGSMSVEKKKRELERISRRMLDAFFPKDPKWRQSCVELGLLRFDQLVQNLDESKASRPHNQNPAENHQ